MFILSKGNFMGIMDSVNNAGGVITSLSYYPDEAIWDEQLHCHETLHLSMVLKGGNLEKRKTRDIECLPGIVTYYDAGEPHHSVLIMPGSRQFNVEITDEFLSAHGIPGNAGSLEKCNPADLKFFMLRMYREFLINDQESSLSITSALLPILDIPGGAANGHGMPGWVSIVKEVLHDQWRDNISLNHLAVLAGTHPVNLSRYFPIYFGCTIGEYRRKLKLEKALELVKYSSLSLTAIALQAGFSDQSHFTRTCKEISGWNPRQLKAMRLK